MKHLCDDADSAGLFAGVWQLKQRLVLVRIKLLALRPIRLNAIGSEDLQQSITAGPGGAQ